MAENDKRKPNESFRDSILRQLDEINKNSSMESFSRKSDFEEENRSELAHSQYRRKLPTDSVDLTEMKQFEEADELDLKTAESNLLYDEFNYDDFSDEVLKLTPKESVENINQDFQAEEEQVIDPDKRWAQIRRSMEEAAAKNQVPDSSSEFTSDSHFASFEEVAATHKASRSLSRVEQATGDLQVDNTEYEYEYEEKPARKSNKKSKKDKEKKNPAGKIIAVIVLVLLLAGAGASWYGYHYISDGIKPLNPADKKAKSVSIPSGASSKQIGIILEKDGVIKNATLFQYYTKFKNFTGFKSGYHNISPNMTLSAIAKNLQQDGTEAPTLGKIVIPEGYTLKQIAKAVESDSNQAKTGLTSDAFMKVVESQDFISKMSAKYPSLFDKLPEKSSGVKYQLEGYLFPATYDYTKSTTAESLAEAMIAAMDSNLEPYYESIDQKKMTVPELLSLASLVEKEGNSENDRKGIARVFFNRMNQDMTLGSNVAILYAEGKLGTKTTLKEDATVNTKIDSAYNLYENTGYGPGPVDSPSLSAIKAVLSPAEGDDLYFVADVTTGQVYFAKTLDEHTANVEKYVNSKL